jgi:hypothetical protein
VCIVVVDSRGRLRLRLVDVVGRVPRRRVVIIVAGVRRQCSTRRR